jgi:hypothetical protein
MLGGPGCLLADGNAITQAEKQIYRDYAEMKDKYRQAYRTYDPMHPTYSENDPRHNLYNKKDGKALQAAEQMRKQLAGQISTEQGNLDREIRKRLAASSKQ